MRLPLLSARLALVLLAAAAPLRAVTTTLSGAINSNSPSFLRPTGGTSDANLVLTPPFTAGTTSYKYFTQTITPSVTGAYDITVTGTTGDTDPYLFIYSPTFSAAAPLTNAIVANDDQPASVRFSKIPAFNLTAGTTYVIVATFFNAAATGTITLDLVGPGTVAISGGPTVSGVTSSTADASYAGGSSISIQVSFSTAVTVTGTPTLALNTSPARSATYTSGSGTSTLTFTYLVQPGDTSADLDYAATTSLAATGGATITNATGTSATLTLAAPGASGSLGQAKAIVVASTSGATVPYAWGGNSYGQLANGTSSPSKVPVAVTVSGALAGKTVTAMAGGSAHSLMLTSDGRVFAAGANYKGQLGNNSTTASNVPVAVNMSGALAGKTVTAIATGYDFSLALTSDGGLFAWGNGEYGQLGTGAKTGSNVPVAIPATGALAGKTITAIAAGVYHAAALGSDGRIYVWGLGSNGQFGDNNVTKNSTVPVLVPNTGALAGKTISAISVANSKVLALASDGTLFEWGYPRITISGSSTSYGTPAVPQAVLMSGALSGKTVTRIAAGNSHNLVLTSDGLVFAWGSGNAVGAPTVNGGSGSTDPVAVDRTGVLAGKTVTAIAAGEGFSLALTSEGKVVAWGENGNGQIGADTGTLPDPFARFGGSNSFFISQPRPAPAKSPVAVDTSGVLNGTVVTALATLYGAGSSYVLAGGAAAPVVASVAVPADAGYGTGAALNFTLTFSSAVTVTGTPTLSLTVGSTARSATYVSGSGTTALLFRYTVQAGETDADGIALDPTIALSGGTLTGAGGTAGLAFAPPNLGFVRVDTAAPAPTASLRKSPLAASVTGKNVGYRVVFSKAVKGVTATSFTLTATGTAAGTIGAVSEVGTGSYDVVVGSLAGSGTLRLDVNASGSGITDLAGNAITAGFSSGETYTLVPSVSQPVISSADTASGTYGTAFTYTIAASNTPASFTATGLPTGLALNATTGAITGTPTQAGNFTVSLGAINTGGTGTAALTLTVAKASLTVTASAASRAVATANPTFALTYAGFVNGDTVTALTAAPLGSCPADVLSATGTYTITPFGGISDNYAFTFVTGTLTVGTVPATLTLSNLSQTYSGLSLSPNVATTPANVPVALTYGGSATLPVNAGTYAVVATSISASYPGTTNGSLVIAKAGQIVTLGALPTTLPLKDFVGALQLTATSTSGLAVVLTLDAGSAATLNGSNQLTAIGTTGTVTLRANQAGDGNYNAATEVVASFNVVKSNQSLTFAKPANVEFGVVPYALTATASSALTPTFTVVSGPATVAGSTLTVTGAGDITVRASQVGDGTFNAAPDVTRTFTAFKTTQSITFADLANATYGDAPLTLAATASSGLAVTYAVASGPATIAGSTLTITGAGTVQVTASQAGSANVATAPDFTKPLVVAPKALTATAQNASRSFGTVNPALTVSYAGLIVTDTAATALLTPVIPSTTAGLLSAVGTYSISVSGGAATNYTTTLVAGTLTVGKASQTLTFTAPPAQVYGNAAFTLGAAASSGLTPTYTIVSGPATVSGGTVTLTGVGTVTVKASQAGDATYDAATDITQSFAVTAKPLTVAGVTASNKVYDGALTATLVTTGATLVGVQGGDTVTLVATSATGAFATKTVATAKTVTVAGLTLGGASAANYTLTQPTATANITAKPLTVTGIVAATKVYDAALPATLTTTGAALVGVVSPDVVTLSTTGATGAFATKVIGTAKTVTVSGLTIAGTDTGNYTLTQPTATADITAKNLTVTGISAANKVYDGNTVATLTTTGAALVGVVGADLVTPVTSAATGAFANSNVGLTKTVQVSGLTLAGTDAGNYTVTQPTATASITPANVSLAITNLSHTYDGTPKSATITATSSVSLTIVYSNAGGVAPTAAGSYLVTANVIDPNYSGTATATLVIAKAGQTVAFTITGANFNVGSSLGLNATATSGLPITFSLVSGSAALSGATATVTTAGTVTLRASQAGDSNYSAASADQSFTGVALAKTAQSIAFAGPGDLATTATPFALSATASSGLPVSFALVSGPAFLSAGNTVTLTGAPGTVTVLASQAGNATFAAAPDVTRSFAVTATVSVADIYFGDLVDDLGLFGEAFVPADQRSVTAKTGDIAAVFYSGTRRGSLIVAAPSLSLNVSLNFTLNQDGTYTIPFTSAGRSLTLNGSLNGTTLIGRIPSLRVAFSTPVQSRAGLTSGIAGYYGSDSLNTATGGTASIVGPNGQLLIVASTAALTTGVLGTVSADGKFNVVAPGATIAGAVDAPSTTVTGTITIPGQATVTFNGLAATTARTDRLINLSSRVRVGPAVGRTLITGFVIGGTASKRVLLRAVGPALTGFGVTGALANPRLQLFDTAGKVLLENDDWTGADTAAAFTQVGAFALAPGTKDAALLATLAPGAYTMQVTAGTETGIALAEIYDASVNPNSEYQRLVNISTRGEVSGGENLLIGGFIVTGNAPKKVLVRGVGPGLAAFGVAGTLTDPRLRVYRGGDLVAENDNWSTVAADATATAAAAGQTGAFALVAGSKDAALILTLAPGAYTAQVSAVDATTGIALVEIYELP